MYVHGACIISLMSSATVQNVGKWHILLVGCIDNVIIRLNVHCTALSQDSTCKISRPDLTLLRVFSITQPPPHTHKFLGVHLLKSNFSGIIFPRCAILEHKRSQGRSAGTPLVDVHISHPVSFYGPIALQPPHLFGTQPNNSAPIQMTRRITELHDKWTTKFYIIIV